MIKTEDVAKKRFGKLTTTSNYILGNHGAKWECFCDCGKKVWVRRDALLSGHTKSCGCIHLMGAHKHSNTRIYKIFQNMKQRCYNPKNTSYKSYGGRGITVCNEWKDNFISFYNWAVNNGYRDDLTIDRIDVNENYCPENCRWATRKEQARNMTTNRIINVNGEKICLAEFCEKNKLNYKRVSKRTWSGMSFDNAIKRRKNFHFIYLEYNGEKKSLSEWAKIKGIREKTLWSRIKELKWDAEKALNKPIQKHNLT